MRILFPIAAALLLSGCIKFGAEPPATLLRLTPEASPPAAASRVTNPAEAVTVVLPNMPQELRTPRVPVRTGDTQVAYLVDAQWVELPNALFQRLLSDTIAARTGRVVLDARQFTFDPGIRVTGQLLAFGVDASSMEAVVVYDAAIGRGPDRVETRRFEQRVPVTAVDAASAGPALNQAANLVAADVAAWLGASAT